VHLIDPTPALEEMYERELAALIAREGTPQTRQERRAFNAEKRALRRRIFRAMNPGAANW
jgi:hypothetical protein